MTVVDRPEPRLLTPGVLATALGELNDSIFTETTLPQAQQTSLQGRPQPAGLALDRFKNF